jgi:hypothetical protein
LIQTIEGSPAETLELLLATHVKQLSVDVQRCLAARAVAGSTAAAASRLFLSERAFRDRLRHAETVLLEPAGMAKDVALMMLWFALHRHCCTEHGWHLIKTSAVFPAEMT